MAKPRKSGCLAPLGQSSASSTSVGEQYARTFTDPAGLPDFFLAAIWTPRSPDGSQEEVRQSCRVGKGPGVLLADAGAARARLAQWRQTPGLPRLRHTAHTRLSAEREGRV